MREFVLAAVLLAVVHETVSQGSDFVINQRRKVKCYECNVFRGSYGIKCEEPIETWPKRDDCEVCMKVSTTAREHHHKFKVLVSTVESRICVQQARDARSFTSCYNKPTNAGEQTECYCETDYCNSSYRSLASIWTLILSVVTVLYYHLCR